jgi:hypothetical protein
MTTETTRYTFRELRMEDLASWLETRARCFPEDAPMDEECFHKLYTSNPAGGRILVAMEGEEVVASYAAQPTRVRVGEELRSFSHVVDSMVHPEHRRGLKNPGLFVRTAETFFERYQDMDAVHYGWPVERALKIGRRFLEYRVLREELALVRGLDETPREPELEVVQLDSLGPEVFALWERCASNWEASAVRDADFLRWRFMQHPRRSYSILACQEEDGALAGLCVVGSDELHSQGTRALADWLVPLGAERVASSLESAARSAARASGGQRLVASLPPWSEDFKVFQELSWKVQSTPYSLCVRSFERRIDLDLLGRGWWLTFADGDLA